MAKLAKQIKKRTTPTNPIWKRTIPFCGYNIYWWAYPIGVIFALIDKLQNHHYDSMKWSEAKAKKMADRYFGKVCDIDEEGLWLCMEWGDYCFAHRAHWWDRAWLARYGYQMKQYIFDDYEIEGYEKKINPHEQAGDTDDWVLFSKVGACCQAPTMIQYKSRKTLNKRKREPKWQITSHPARLRKFMKMCAQPMEFQDLTLTTILGTAVSTGRVLPNGSTAMRKTTSAGRKNSLLKKSRNGNKFEKKDIKRVDISTLFCYNKTIERGTRALHRKGILHYEV